MTTTRRRKFTLGEAAAIAGISPKLLAIWIDRGFVHPAQEASGRGTHRLFSETNLLEIKMIAALRSLDVAFEGIAPLTAAVRAVDDLETLSGRVVLVRQPGGEVRLLDESEVSTQLDGPPAPTLTIPLWWHLLMVRAEIDRQRIGQEAAFKKAAERVVNEDIERNGLPPIDQEFLNYYEAKHGRRGLDGNTDDDHAGDSPMAADQRQEGEEPACQGKAARPKGRRRVAGRSPAA